MRTHSYEIISGIVFLLLGTFQFLRFIFRWDIMAGSYIVPLWPSALVFVFMFYLGYQGLKLSRLDK